MYYTITHQKQINPLYIFKVFLMYMLVSQVLKCSQMTHWAITATTVWHFHISFYLVKQWNNYVYKTCYLEQIQRYQTVVLLREKGIVSCLYIILSCPTEMISCQTDMQFCAKKTCNLVWKNIISCPVHIIKTSPHLMKNWLHILLFVL